VQRNGQKRDTNQNEGKKLQDSFGFLNFFGKKVLTWTSSNKFLMVLLNSPCRKRTKTQQQPKVKN
jgi:hypothetical protein